MIFAQPILSHTHSHKESGSGAQSTNKWLGSIIWLDLLLLSQIYNYLKMIQHGQILLLDMKKVYSESFELIP